MSVTAICKYDFGLPSAVTSQKHLAFRVNSRTRESFLFGYVLYIVENTLGQGRPAI